MLRVILVLAILLFGITVNSQTTFPQIGDDIDGEAAGDLSGWSVSLSSDGFTLAIGAPENNGTDSFAGHVRIYEFITGNWIQKGNDIDGEALMDYSGTSVSISSDGSIVAVGAPYNNGGFGQVRIYQYLVGIWTQMGSDIDGESSGDVLGRSVSLSSDGYRVAIGAPNEGYIKIFEYDGSNWIQLGSTIIGETASDQFGYSVSLSDSGNMVAVGAPYNTANGTNAGHVRIYEYNGGSWTQIGSDIDSEADGDYSGWSVSLNSDGLTIAIGAWGNDGTNIAAGHVRVYEYNGGSWTQKGSDIDGEAFADNSGWSVSLSSDGNSVAIGARSNSGTGAGHVRIYHYSSGIWTQIGSDIDSEAAGDQSGYSVSLNTDGTIVAIGAIWNNGNGTESGHVRVYDICGTTNTVIDTVCTSYTSPSGNHIWTVSGTYIDVIPNSVGCDSVITIVLTIPVPYQNQQLCLVTVDPAIEKNRIMWEAIPNEAIGSYCIQKEVAYNVYNAVVTVSADSLNYCIDYSSNPASHSDKYKITVIDTCGAQSDINSSYFHKTINLVIAGNQTTMGLTWEKYEIEDGSFVPNQYYVYRGTTPFNLQLLDSLPGSPQPIFTYNDLNITTVYYYMIGVVRDDCGAGTKQLYTAFSNKKDNTDQLGISEHKPWFPLSIYPNPFNESTTIQFSNPNKSSYYLRLSDITGKIIREINDIKDEKVIIQRNELSSGMYMIELVGEKNYKGKIMVK
ncbi:MAG: T9SS type A sorting domain-containing protein [Bacteroidota bacterium]